MTAKWSDATSTPKKYSPINELGSFAKEYAEALFECKEEGESYRYLWIFTSFSNMLFYELVHDIHWD